MRGAAAAGGAAGIIEGFVHDLADGAQAAAALRAAAEAAVDLRGGTRRRRSHGGAHLMVAQHVAGTDDHRLVRNPRRRQSRRTIFRYRLHSAESKQKRSLKMF